MNAKRILAAAAVLSFIVLSGPASFAGDAADKGGYVSCTVSDVFTKKDTLVGKKIAIKGKIVKASSGIMGTNWYHIKDGTGSAGTDDFTFTSKDSAKVGDEVVARGELSKDVDFGAGYKYSVIIKDGSISSK